MPGTDTSLDERGFRRFCRDGHRIAWFAPNRMRPRSGDALGQCTAGDWWNQEQGRTADQMRLKEGSRPLRGGGFEFVFTYAAVQEEGSTPWKAVDESRCAGGHYSRHDGGLRRDLSAYADSAARYRLISDLEAEGWRIETVTVFRGRGILRREDRQLQIWCPECIAEWNAFTAELESWRKRETSELTRSKP